MQKRYESMSRIVQSDMLASLIILLEKKVTLARSPSLVSSTDGILPVHVAPGDAGSHGLAAREVRPPEPERPEVEHRVVAARHHSLVL